MASTEQTGLPACTLRVDRRRPALRQQARFRRGSLFLQMGKDFLDQRRVFDAGNHFHRAAAFTAGLASYP